MSDFADILENIDQMPVESQEILIDIINKRFAEKKRDMFINETLKSREEFDKGDYQSGNKDDLFKALDI